MKRAFKILAWLFGVPLLLLIGSIVADRVLASRAKPPQTVTDVASCLGWLRKPMGAYKITDGEKIYYRVTAPAGRCLPSGPSAYTFDSRGKFVGWTPDMGDLPTPGLHISDGAKREKLSLEELRRSAQ